MTTEERLEKLERQSKHQRFVLVALSLCLLGVVTIAAASGGLKADSLEILQPNGKTGILLKATDDGGAICIYGPSRKDGPMSSIFAIPQEKGGGTQFFMRGSQGQKAVNIVAQREGNIHTW